MTAGVSEKDFKRVLRETRERLEADVSANCLEQLAAFAVRAPFRKRALALLKEVPDILARAAAEGPVNAVALDAFASTAVALNYPILGKAIRKAYALAARDPHQPEAFRLTGRLALAMGAYGVTAAIPEIKRVLDAAERHHAGESFLAENRRGLELLLAEGD